MAKARRKSLARGWEWPVTTGHVRDGLGDMFDAVSLVWYDTHGPNDDVAWVRWKSEASRIPAQFPADANSATVWLVPATSDNADTLADLLQEQILPEMADWLRSAFESDDAWQDRTHEMRWSVKDGDVAVAAYVQPPGRSKRR